MAKILNKILKINFDNTIKQIEQEFPENYSCHINAIKNDYKNFLDANIPIKFKIENNEFCKKFKEISKKAFSDLKYITKNLYGEDIYIQFQKEFGTVTFKEAFILSYYNHNQPRCCFCGSLLPASLKRKEQNNKYKYSDVKFIKAEIEHLFPQSNFPQFIFHPYNLAPICPMCNFVKSNKFFNSKKEFCEAIEAYGIKYYKLHPFNLYKKVKFNSDTLINGKYSNNSNLFEFYNLEKRGQIVLDKCFSILFNIIRHSDIRSPESLERLLENIASSNWHEVNDGYSLNNSPQIWQEFIESILYDECKLMALLDEVKEYNKYILK